jgi:hypothetical protein
MFGDRQKEGGLTSFLCVKGEYAASINEALTVD